MAGKAVSIGPLVNLSDNFANGKLCSTDVLEGLVIQDNTIVTILDENTPLSDVYIVQEDPLITNLGSFFTITPTNLVCIESGIIIDGLLDVVSFVNKSSDGSCPVSTVQINSRVTPYSGLSFDQNLCVKNSFLYAGRVLVESESVIVKKNETLSPGSLCDFQPIFRPSGVVLSEESVIIIIPNKTLDTTTKPYYNTAKYYDGRGYYKSYENARNVYRSQDERYPHTYQKYEDNYYRKQNRNMGKSRNFGRILKLLLFIADLDEI